MNAPPPIPSRTLRLFAAAVKWSLWLLLAGWLLLSLAWGALHGWIVPRIGEMRPALEAEASRALGVPVRIGGITARSEGLIPSFELRDVSLHDPQGRAALKLPLVVAALSPRSLWNLGFEQLYIARPELDIRRAADGRIYVGGLDFSRGAADDGRGVDWFLAQTEFVLEGGRIQWTDDLRQAPPLALQDVRFLMRNRARRHDLRLEATPPPGWGSRFSVTGRFRQPLLSAVAARKGWQHWVGQVHADFNAVDLSQLRRHAHVGIDIAQGRGRLRAWADIDRGQLTGGTADIVLQDVSATLAPRLPPLTLDAVSGRIGGKRVAGGFELHTQELQFVTADGQRWPGGNLALSWIGAEGQAPARGELKADRLDLGALSQIATRLPLGTATHAALQAYSPQGLVETLQARWQGPLGAPLKYEARGRASRLQVTAQGSGAQHAGMPGVRGAAIDFDLHEAGGRARLAIQSGALEFPGVFEQPAVPLDSLGAEVLWQVQGEALSVSVDRLKFANADAEGEGQVRWRTGERTGDGGARYPGVLDLQASISRANGTRVWRYLPLGVGKPTRDYVQQAVQAGTASNARFRVKGDLRDFPFTDPAKGQFLITAQVKDVHFAYVPRPAETPPVETWPALTQLAAELRFEGNGMQVRGASGRFGGSPRLAFKADARLPDFNRSEVSVDGQVRGPLADALATVNGSVIGGLLNQALAATTATGPAEVDLQLVLPVEEIARSRVRGTVTLVGNDLQITPDSPALARTRGVVNFSDKGFQLSGVQARALGGDVRLDGGSRAGAAAGEPTVALRAQGTATAEGLRQARELGFVARLARDFAGSAAYQLALGFRPGGTDILVTSPLQGLSLNLPAPLAKPAEAMLPLRYEVALARDGRPRDTLSLEVGRVLQLAYQRDLSGGEPQVLRGGVAVGLAPGESLAVPEEGVQANIQLGAFNVDAWEELLARVAGAEGAAAPEAALRVEGSAASGYLPTVLAVRAKELNVEGRILRNVVAGGSRDGRIWRANVDADELNGYVEYRQPQGGGSGRVLARLARLNVGQAVAGDVEALLEQQPSGIPALDIVVDDFELRGRKLGRLEIDAVNRGAGAVARDGGVREWRLNRLSLAMPEAVFTASGNWAALAVQAPPVTPPRSTLSTRGAERRRTVMKFNLDIADAGVLLGRFGMKGIVRGGRGAMQGTVAWLGSPLALDYPSMTGSFNIDMASGQFLKAEPGLAKLLGVLSLQTLPRRLALDFRDVFSEGFLFDFVRGDVNIEHGIAATNNLQMKGVNAAVLMEGRADIARETQDLKVVVVPEINAGTASLVATVINPAIGVGTFLAQLFLREPLIRAATQEFHIDGTWADPRVTRVARTAAAPVQSIPPPSTVTR